MATWEATTGADDVHGEVVGTDCDDLGRDPIDVGLEVVDEDLTRKGSTRPSRQFCGDPSDDE